MNFVLVLLILGMTIIAKGQGSNEWHMVLNKDHSAFKINIINNEMTFIFNYQNDTLSFSQGNKKTIKSGFYIEISFKNNNKVVYTSTDKNLNGEKSEIIIPMADVYNSLKTTKIPSKPKYVISIKDNKVVKEKLLFEFAEK
jgi:hypothetical protein